MTENGRRFVDWHEQFVSQERGHRVVHYFLKDSAGESILAIVGTERSVRHMFYVVSDDFVRVYGTENSIHSGYKWRSRREVVDWLSSMLSKQYLQGNQSKLPKYDLAQSLESSECPMKGFGAEHAQGRPFRNLNRHNSDIVWSGVPWTCGKQLKHYPAFYRNGTTIDIQSFVFVMAKGENYYIAYLEDMYEDKRGQKKVKVRWFHRNQEVKGVLPVRNMHPKEVFITHYSQVISAECVDGPATVLTREHYEECFAAFPNASSTRIHLCYRQFRSNKVKPFDLSKLRGYFDQPIISCLNSKSFPRLDSLGYCVENEGLRPSENVKLGSKRARSDRGCEAIVTDDSRVRITDSQMVTFQPSYLKLRNGLPGKRLPLLKHVECHRWFGPPFKVDEKIELLCQDSGIRGCWFRCTVLHVSRKNIKVQYDDVQDEDEYSNLEEWILAFKLAVPDKLGMRYSDRPIIRPVPLLNQQTDISLEVGCAVDAWWSDGWWEGVVTGVSNSDDNVLQVYFPGENFFLNVHKKDLRLSRDWLGDQWVDIRKKPDIISAISTTVNPDTKLAIASTTVKDFKSGSCAVSCTEVPVSVKFDVTEEKRPNKDRIPSDSHVEDVHCYDGGKPPSSNENPNGDGGNDVNVSDENVEEVQGNVICEGDGDDNGDKLDAEVVEKSEKKCEAIELMELTA